MMPQLGQRAGLAAPGAAVRQAPTPVAVTIAAGSGRLLQLPSPAASVIAAEPRIARVEPTSPTSLFVMAVAAGRTTVVATADDGSPIAEYQVTVTPGPFDQVPPRSRRRSAPARSRRRSAAACAARMACASPAPGATACC
jgi:pilus assembly protein CpaC